MKLKRLIVTLAAAVMLSGTAIGCGTEANKVSANISAQADNFNITRKLTVLKRKNRYSPFGADWNICIKEQFIK